MKVLFIIPYPAKCAPSQRFRFEQYLPLLLENGITYDLEPFLSEKTWTNFYKKGHFFQKLRGVLSGYLRRYGLLFSLSDYDVIFIHRESSPLGPAFYSWVLAKVFKKKIIFDFDDAIWLENYSHGNRLFAWLKNYRNALSLMKWSSINSCGNKYLMAFAKEYNPNSVYMPTTVDTHNSHLTLKKTPNKIPVIGWTGTHSTSHYLHDIENALSELKSELDFEIIIICDQDPKLDLEYRFVKWNEANEVKDLQQLDIGLMPLKADKWSEGKCSLKALQYMSLGIVPVVSPVGVNKDIVTHGKNGLFCEKESEWIEMLRELLQSENKRKTISEQTRPFVEDNFSVQSNAPKFLHLFTKIKQDK